jgi:type IV pilus assembly protein PilY1
MGKLSQTAYNAITPVLDSGLVQITDVDTNVPAGSPGWRFELSDGGWRGEKALAEARTFNNQVFFTTFTPGISVGADPCQPALGVNRLYVMSIFNGAPVTNLDGSADPDILTNEDRYIEFNGSIAAEVVFLFPSPEDSNCIGEQCTPPPVACVDLFCMPTNFANNPIRTLWRQDSVD